MLISHILIVAVLNRMGNLSKQSICVDFRNLPFSKYIGGNNRCIPLIWCLHVFAFHISRAFTVPPGTSIGRRQPAGWTFYLLVVHVAGSRATNNQHISDALDVMETIIIVQSLELCLMQAYGGDARSAVEGDRAGAHSTCAYFTEPFEHWSLFFSQRDHTSTPFWFIVTWDSTSQSNTGIMRDPVEKGSVLFLPPGVLSSYHNLSTGAYLRFAFVKMWLPWPAIRPTTACSVAEQHNRNATVAGRPDFVCLTFYLGEAIRWSWNTHVLAHIEHCLVGAEVELYGCWSESVRAGSRDLCLLRGH